jgi:RNase adapter protein RapZ
MKSRYEKISLLIVTGYSGAGKTQCLKLLEDLDYYCVDNLPLPLLPQFTDLLLTRSIGRRHQNTAIVIDVRGGDPMADLQEYLATLQDKEIPYTILFFEASDEILVRRFSETRRKHPLSEGKGNLSAIITEKGMMKEIRSHANYIIDTTHFGIKDLKDKILSIVSFHGDPQSVSLMTINIISFGYKRGVPIDADLVFDVRFLPNPFYIEDLKPLTGMDQTIQEFVINNHNASIFLQKVADFLTFLIPLYYQEGKTQLTVGFGCTGGRHRSVSVASVITELLVKKGYNARLTHRDIHEEGGI